MLQGGQSDFFELSLANFGQDDIGKLQASGLVVGAKTHDNGLKTRLTLGVKATGTVTLDSGAPVAATQTFTVDTSITEGLHAESVLTSSGASVPAVYAESVVTASTIIDGDTMTVDATVYRFKTTPDQAYDINLGANDAAALDNAKLAINASGVGDGTDYFAGTLAHPTVIATTNTDTTQKVVARIIGTASNAEATTSTGGTLTWADTTLGGGTGASVAGVVTTAALITIDTTVYTIVTSLAETHGLTAIPFQVLWVTSEAVMLDNLKSAINNTATEGTDYATGTTAHPLVVATTNTATTQLVVAKLQGTAINVKVTEDTVANLAWTGADFTNGTVAGVDGDTVTVGTTVYTFVDILSEDHADAVINQVLWVTSDAVALDNFKSAVNLTGSIGTDYSTGTAIHPDVTATTNTNTTQVVAAKIVGTAGNAIVTTETGSTLSWGAGTLAGGLDASVDGILVDGVEIMSGVEAFDTDLDTTATNSAANITANTSAPNYSAVAVGAVITIKDESGQGAGANGLVVVASTITIATTDVNMASGTTETTKLKVGQSISVLGTTSYNDVHEILEIPSVGDVVIDDPFVADESGTWDLKGAKGKYAGFLVMNAVVAADITTLDLGASDEHYGDPKVLPYLVGSYYPFAAMITKIILAPGSSADLRLIRYQE